MSFIVRSIPALTTYTGDTLVVPVTLYATLATPLLKQLDSATSGALALLLKSKEFSGQEGESAVLYRPNLGVARIIMVGLGDSKKLTHESFRKGMGTASRLKSFSSAHRVGIVFHSFAKSDFAQASVEGLLLGAYKFLDYKTGKNAPSKVAPIQEITFLCASKDAAKKLQLACNRGEIIAEGQILARRLKETPGNDLTPRIYAEKAKELARKHGLQCTILDEKAIAKEKMGGLIAVGQGSVEPPRFIILRYQGGAKGQKPIVLVGKGVTFDTGGISIKPAADMQEMKQDMGGSAAMLATIVTAARLKIRQNIVVLIPTTENMPSGSAYKPGDIITMRSGKTVEIINTDAEGRLILADALDYANTFNPQAVIDIATLTGAARFILGFAGAPIMGNSKKLMNGLREAADSTAERVWELPIWQDYHDQMKSSVADLVNSGPPYAGTLAAAAFLEEFIGNWPWAHIDIAYVDLEKAGRPYVPKGATGFGVRLLVELLANWKKA